MKRSLRVGWALLLAWVLQADFEPARWQLRRTIVAPAAGLVRIAPDNVLYRGSLARLADVRVLRGNQEVPYILETRRGVTEQRRVAALMLNKASLPGVGVQFTLDAGTGARHNEVVLATSLRNFKNRVRVETSEDGREWSVARNDGTIFDVTEADRPASGLVVGYPPSTRRFVRVTVFGWSKPESITGAWLRVLEDRPEVRQTTVTIGRPPANEVAQGHRSELVIDIGFAGLPHDVAVLTVDGGAFSRMVEVATSPDGKAWTDAGQGVIARTPWNEILNVRFGEVWDRYLRVSILNGDDQPLAVRKIELQTIERAIVFRADRPGAYELYYGNAAGREPAYDLAATLVPGALEAAVPAMPAAEQVNPAYQPPATPFSDRNPWVLYGLLAVVVLAMGWITVTFLRKVGATNVTGNRRR